MTWTSASSASCFAAFSWKGFARPLAGVRLILRNLVRRFRSLGGELRLRSGVARIQIENGRAVGVVLDNGEELAARNVLSSAGLVETMRLSGDTERVTAASTGPDVVYRDDFRSWIGLPKQLGHEQTIVFFNDSDQFHWERPHERVVRCPFRRHLLAEQLPVRRGSVAGRCHARDTDGRLRSLVAACRKKSTDWPSCTGTTSRWNSASALRPRVSPPHRRDRHVYAAHHLPLHLARQRSRLRCSGKTPGWPNEVSRTCIFAGPTRGMSGSLARSSAGFWSPIAICSS